MRLFVIALLVAATGSLGHANELERLREENARLRARIEALESENAKLRGAADTSGLATAIRESARETVRTEVETSTGRTVVETDPSLLDVDAGPRSRHWITLRAHPGNGGAAEAELVIVGAASGGAYRDVPALDLALDGTRETLSRLRYASERVSPVRGGGATLRETVVLGVPAGALGRMAAARRVDGTLGPLRFHLTPVQLASVQELADRIGAKR